MNRKRRLMIEDFNPHIICVLCGGYFIDATTIIECLHSFCRACIVHYLETNRFCPICDVQVHKSKPLQNIRPDRTLQDLVYKLVPGLYQSEMKSRKEFYESHPECAPCDDIANESFVYTPEECFSLTLEYYEESNHPHIKYPARMIQEPVTGDEDSRSEESRGDLALSNTTENEDKLNSKSKQDSEKSTRRRTDVLSQKNSAASQEDDPYKKQVPCITQVDAMCDTWQQPNDQTCNEHELERLRDQQQCKKEETVPIKKRHLRCPAAVTITHLQKLIRAKYDLPCNHPVEILHRDEPLSDHLTLIDVAYIYKWRRKGPLNLYFRIFDVHNDQHRTQDVNTQVGEPGIKTGSMEVDEKVKIKNKVDDWKEVQLQISETGIMSVAGISLEHNNNLTSTNNNLLSDATSKCSNQLGTVTESEKVGSKLAVGGKDLSNVKKSNLESKFVPPTETKIDVKMPILNNLAKQSNVSVTLTNKNVTGVVNRGLGDQSFNPVKVKTEVCVSVDNKINNVGSEKRKNATPMKIPESCANTPKRTKLSPMKPCESLDLSLKPVKKENVTNSTILSEPANINDTEIGYKPFMKSMPSNTSSKSDLDAKRPFPSDQELNLKEKNPTTSTGGIVPAVHSKKSPNSNSVGYKTLKVPPKTWNPSITRSSYLNSKASPDCHLNSNSIASPVKAQEKVLKFFKMRNMPRYLGNPASGVKPMYHVAADSKTQDSSSKSKQVVMKIDPKTLCPIISSAVPATSSTSATRSPGKPFYTAPASPDIGSSAADATKTSPRHKSNSPSRKVQVPIPTPSVANSSPSVGFSHAARTGSPFANTALKNAAQTNAALSVRSPPATTSNNILLNPSSYAINPATLNLLSSNLSFLPNASNFLYGNYTNFAPPLIRPNLSMSGSGSGLPGALPLGAFHAMPPSINMLFPHHRTNSSSGFTPSTNRAQTPAIQRIPASKGGANNNSASCKTAKSANLPSPKNNQTPAVQNPVNNHTLVKTNSSTHPLNMNENSARERPVVHKKNSIHKEEVTHSSTIQTNNRSEVNLSNNNNNNNDTNDGVLPKSKNGNISTELMSFNSEDMNPPIVDAPAPVTLVEKCDATKEASPATDSTGQNEPEDTSSKLGIDTSTSIDMKSRPSTELVITDASCKHTEIANVPELFKKSSDIDYSDEQSLGAGNVIDGCCGNSKSSMTIESKEKVVK